MSKSSTRVSPRSPPYPLLPSPYPLFLRENTDLPSNPSVLPLVLLPHLPFPSSPPAPLCADIHSSNWCLLKGLVIFLAFRARACRLLSTVTTKGMTTFLLRVWRCSVCEVWGCEGVRVWRCEDVKVWRCEGVRMWWRLRMWSEDVEWGCEGVRKWRCEDVHTKVIDSKVNWSQRWYDHKAITAIFNAPNNLVSELWHQTLK